MEKEMIKSWPNHETTLYFARHKKTGGIFRIFKDFDLVVSGVRVDENFRDLRRDSYPCGTVADTAVMKKENIVAFKHIENSLSDKTQLTY
jgi:hypothetical protein